MGFFEKSLGECIVGLRQAGFEVPQPFQIPGFFADFDECSLLFIRFSRKTIRFCEVHIPPVGDAYQQASYGSQDGISQGKGEACT